MRTLNSLQPTMIVYLPVKQPGIVKLIYQSRIHLQVAELGANDILLGRLSALLLTHTKSEIEEESFSRQPDVVLC